MKCDSCIYKNCFFRGGKCPKDNWDKEEETPPETITLKCIYSTHCQVCGKPHANPLSIVYYVPLDNVVACLDCAEGFGPGYEARIYKEG